MWMVSHEGPKLVCGPGLLHCAPWAGQAPLPAPWRGAPCWAGSASACLCLGRLSVV